MEATHFTAFVFLVLTFLYSHVVLFFHCSSTFFVCYNYVCWYDFYSCISIFIHKDSFYWRVTFLLKCMLIFLKIVIEILRIGVTQNEIKIIFISNCLYACASGSKLSPCSIFFVKFLNACVSGFNKVSAWLLTKKPKQKNKPQTTNKLRTQINIISRHNQST